MGRYAEWRASFDETRAERVLQRSRADDAAEAARAEARALEVARLRGIRPGLNLDLSPADWLDLVSQSSDRHVKLRVASIHEPIQYRDGVGWVRVWGHSPDCGSEHAPCITLMARVGAILDTAATS